MNFKIKKRVLSKIPNKKSIRFYKNMSAIKMNTMISVKCNMLFKKKIVKTLLLRAKT